MKRILLTIAIVICFVAMSDAADYCVDAINGSNITGDGSKTKPWKSITFALQQVWGTGHTIRVAAGKYDTSLETFPIKMKNSISLVGAGPDSTILDAEGTNPVIVFQNVTDRKTKIESFTLTGGKYLWGQFDAGGINLNNSSPTIINNKIINNVGRPNMAGGIACLEGSSPIIEYNIISSNTAGEYNTASGIELWGMDTNPIIRYNTIEKSNRAGISIMGSISSFPLIKGNIIRQNGNYGIYADFTAATIIQNIISEHQWGIYLYRINGKIEKNIIAHNRDYGIFIRSVEKPGPIVTNNTIDDNGYGGVCLDNTFGNVEISVFNNNIISNTNGCGVIETGANAEMKCVEYNLFYNNKGHYLDKGTNKYYSVQSMDESVPECKNNIEYNPKFVDVAHSNYNLLSDSPAIDAGDPNSPLDPDGSRADIGALSVSPPAPPSNFSAIAGDFQVSLFWSPNFGLNLAYYVIYRSQTSGFTPSHGNSIAKLNKMDTTFVDIGVNNGIAYYYRICAVDSIPELTLRKSEPSEEVSVTPHSAPPAPPQNLQAIAGDSQVTLTWNPNTEVDMSHYIIYRSLTANFTPAKNDSIGQVDHPSADFLDSGLNNGTTYYYRITAIDVENVESEPSDEVYVIPIGVHSILISSPNAEATVDSVPVGISGVFNAWGDYTVEVNGVKAEINGINFSAEIYLTNGPRQIIARLLDSGNNILSSDTINVSVIAPTPCIGTPGEYYGVYHKTVNGIESGVKFEVDRFRTQITTFYADLILINKQIIPWMYLFLDVTHKNKINIINNSFSFQRNIDEALTYSFSGTFETKNFASGSYSAILDPFYGSWDWSVTNDTAKVRAYCELINFPQSISPNIETEYQVLIRNLLNTPLLLEYAAEIHLSSGIRIFDSNPKQIFLNPNADSILTTNLYIPTNSPIRNATLIGILGTTEEPIYVHEQKIILDPRPTPFNLLYPFQGDTTNTDTIAFRWQSSKSPFPDRSITYTFYYDDNPNFNTKKSIQGIIDTTYTINGNLISRTNYWWYVIAKDNVGLVRESDPYYLNTKVESFNSKVIPEKYDLCQNYPNPFNPETTIKYQLSKRSDVVLKIYNITGELVKTLIEEKQPAGYHSVIWNGRDEMGQDVASGLYFYQLRVKGSKDNFIQMKKMLLVR